MKYEERRKRKRRGEGSARVDGGFAYVTRRFPTDSPDISASTEAWDTLKASAETAWADLENAVMAAKEKFKKPSESGQKN